MMMLRQVLLLTVATITAFGNGVVTAEDPADLSDAADTTIPLNDYPVPSYEEGVKTSRGRKRPPLFPGGCNRQPDPPINGGLRCSLDSGCIANCERGYKFPNGVTQLAITCSDRQWNILGTDWLSVPHCEPICIPECQNNGVCVAPHQCNCPQDFSGPQCQFENKPCMNYPPPVLNANKVCNSKTCTVSCKENFVFPDGTAVTNLICKNGNWQPTRQDWVSIPDCEPVCNPPCQNGGNCLPSNFCQCPQAYRGPQCQYSADACNGENLGFNGGFTCSGVGDSYTCTLNCPAGVEFEFPPASGYSCDYQTGLFTPQPIPQCKYSENLNVVTVGATYNSYVKEINQSWVYEDFFGSHTDGTTVLHNNYDLAGLHNSHQSSLTSNELTFNPMQNGMVLVQEKRPAPGTCFTWGGVHYKTFDDSVYSFNSECPYVLVQEAQNRLFTVTIQNAPGCKHGDCSRIIKIFVQDKEYSLLRNEAGVPEFRTPKKRLPIPAQLSALRVDMSAHFIVVSLDSLGVQLKWDAGLLVQVEALENMWNKTVGLCGNMNGDKRDDLVSKNGEHTKSVGAFAISWKTEDIGGLCDEYPDTDHTCKSNPVVTQEAIVFCTKLLFDARFKACSGTINLSELRVACLWDYCSCPYDDRRQCACETMNVYVRQCAHKKLVSLAGWRNNATCPMTCTGGRVYMACGPRTESSCWTGAEDRQQSTENCEEGCFCPLGTVAHEGKCISTDECPCRLRGKLFAPGKSVQKDCNTCTCSAGKWICTQVRCSARCAVVGDPHYTTFDGRHFDFMGKCKYYLMKGDDYSIEGENVPCLGAISENMGLVPSDAPSCTKTVTINYRDTSIKLKQHRQVLVNGDDLTVFPTVINGIRIRIASSIFLVVHLPNGLDVWWDGISRVYINAAPDFHGNTKGLCGTFTENQKDDFITPEGDVESTAVAFANKWKCDEVCADMPEKELDHPCDLDPQKRSAAKHYCSYLFSDIFAGCHWHVDPDTFYKDCLYDMCSCKVDVESCLCPTLAAYGKDCAAAGIKLQWRQSVDECRIHCPGSQVYQICGNSCTRSCGDISSHRDCKQECVEGCNCPEGQTLDEHGECIPIGQCPCVYGGMEFQAGHKEIRPGNKALELCTCTGGVWSCREATKLEITEYPAAKDLLTSCVASKHQEVSDCAPQEPRTCGNMHKPVRKPAVCKSGCVCQTGYVLDRPGGECIKQESCPCHHGGQSYTEGAVIQDECNTCQCVNGTWTCTDRTCAGVCSAWGDSHYKTFDGKIFDFQGVCDYVLAKGALSQEDSFDVSIQNVPCGTTGVACSKSVTLTIGGGGQSTETIVLTRGKELPADNFKRIAMRTAGLFVFIDVPDMGLSVQWDRGTRVYVRLEPTWKGRTKGLCGDYNDNSEDDFKTPSGGISEASANLFGDSWKKNEFCPEPKDVRDTCEQHPERMMWAVEKCGILKSPVFQPCHSEVEVESYLHNCVFDTCGCDAGGDCECLCTALAAYAQECNAKGVPIKWRSQELCPIQCDERCSSYSPCVTTCPRETCDNMMTLKEQSRLCYQDTCVEGCSVKSCSENQVYSNDSYTECVARETCRIPCIELDGVTYYEGDTMKSDECQTCSCSRGKVLCKGEPCPTPPTTRVPHEEPQQCVDGWTAWINKHPAKNGTEYRDVERLPTIPDLAAIEGSPICDKNHMVDIRCRTVESHVSAKETGLNAECSLEHGLYCESQPGLDCVDFEISVLCQCPFRSTTAKPEPSSTSKEKYDECNMLDEPYKPHPENCQLFYQCMPGLLGNEFVEKSCGPNMYYNPEIQVCDWPANVLKNRPECSREQTTTGKTEWTMGTKTKYNTTTASTLEKGILTTRICKEGETWSSCAIDCSKACDYYKYVLIKEGKCSGSFGCVPGCVPLETPQCLPHEFWRDAMTCVNEADCTCRSHNGLPVIPNAVLKESDCEICQCINNYYTCDRSSCTSPTSVVITEKPTVQPSTKPATPPSPTSWTETVPTIVVQSTVSPPAPCDSNNYVDLIQQMIDQVSYESSNNGGSLFSQKEPASPNENLGYWEPEYSSTLEWLDIKFPRPTPFYGVVVQGSPETNKFVTSYKILYSEDGHAFSYVLNDRGEPNVFRGPVDEYKPVTEIFYQPIEARVVRINPQTWYNGIAMKVGLYGCQDRISTVPEIVTMVPTVITEKIVTPVCDEPMGLDDGLIFPEQVTASSTSNELMPSLKLSSPGVWHPKLNNPHQFVIVDLLEPRNVTGVATKGGEDSWTTVYKIFYSNDGQQWNPVMDRENIEREFLGNFDSQTVKKNYFDRPLNARYIKVQPIRWHREIGLKLEILGCFLPYPSIGTTIQVVETTPVIVQKCNVCEGVPSEEQAECRCVGDFWWNGNACVAKQECPCVVGHVLYQVGAIYVREDCQECTCTLGGLSFCQPKRCKACQEPGMRPIVNELCNCVCKPCPPGTRHCPTSDVCIDENLWCDGVHNCPDDETDCPMTETTPKEVTVPSTESTSVSTTQVTPVECPEPMCPPGYKVLIKPIRQMPDHIKPHFNEGVKSFRRKQLGRKSLRKSMHHQTKNPELQDAGEIECLQFSCVPDKPPPVWNQTTPETCPAVACPPGYIVVREQMSMYKLQKCPKYTCKPPPPKEVTCNVTGRTFVTFDGIEYKYDICNHILVRDMYFNKWYITLEKQCDSYTGQCVRVLVVTLNENVIVLYPDLHAEINQYSFSRNQIAGIADKVPSFKIATIGDVMYFVSNRYGFWVIWDTKANVKIGISTKWAWKTDGLCGYFDGNPANDRQLPDGGQAKSTVEFGNSWALDDAPECDSQTCPADLRELSWEINSMVKDQSLAVCSNVLDLEKFAADRIEDTCNCLRSNHTNDECRCRLLTSFVTDCQAADLTIDLSTWRTIHDCPASCEPPFVHKDCFRNKCEPGCNNLQQIDPCPAMLGVCFSGCFCPEGTVRNGDQCVPPAQCRDCVCEWLADSRYISFDRRNVKFDGNCTYILSKSLQDNRKGTLEGYQVLVSNEFCDTGICTAAVTILYQGHVIRIKEKEHDKEFQVEVDGSQGYDMPLAEPWLILEQASPEKLRLLIPSIQLELVSYQPNFAFTLSVPSHIFGGAMDGLCGNCNGDAEDDLRQQDGQLTDNPQDFGSSWVVSEVPAGVNLDTSSCVSNNQSKCILPPADQDPCRKLLDGQEFEMCHNLVDPVPYLMACQDSLCSGGGYCDTFEAYSRKCQQMGVCLIWRSTEMCPYTCPPHLTYNPCGSSCKETCDTINEIDPASCSWKYEEGCFCPEKFVLYNDTCIPKEKCFLCDEEGHVEGDTWFPDVCTSCGCSNRTVSCEKTLCPVAETICEESMTPVLVNGTEQDCCPKYLCVPKTVTTVAPFCTEEPQMPECGYGQTIKVTVGSDGCKKFICECVPPSECPPLNDIALEVEELQPGFVQVTNTSGCCPRSMTICDQQTCPAAPRCPEFYEVKANVEWNACCPTYDCVPPKDMCLYTLESESKIEMVERVVAKKIGEEWTDGKCTSCVCRLAQTGPKPSCVTTTCLRAADHPDIVDFVVEEIVTQNECCPSFERTACKDGDTVRKVGEEWQPDPEDSCTFMDCIRDEYGVQKQIRIQECIATCDPGFEYQASTNKSISCCGRCVPVACVVDGTVKNVGEEWFSADYCTKYFCTASNGSVYIESLTEKCPEAEPWELTEFQIEKQYVPGQCCPQLLKTACLYDGTAYKPGEKWKPLDDKCVTEICVLENNVTKYREVEVCKKDCAPGWMYEEQDGECCGKCRQRYCTVGDMLYEPGASWSSPDNCTWYSCMDQGEQLAISSSTAVCPDITDCPLDAIYTQNCCQMCNLTSQNKRVEMCAADVLDAQSTIGMFSMKHRIHGFCKNLEPIEGVSECRGKCDSNSYFDTESWNHVVNCQCCQPTDYKGVIVELVCENQRTLKKQVAVPVSCTCSSCGSNDEGYKGRKKSRVKA